MQRLLSGSDPRHPTRPDRQEIGQEIGQQVEAMELLPRQEPTQPLRGHRTDPAVGDQPGHLRHAHRI